MFIQNKILYLETDLTFRNVASLFTQLNKKGQTFDTIDLGNIKKIDSAGVAFLEELTGVTKKYNQYTAGTSTGYQHF